MTRTAITNMDDTIDSREVIERIEELQADRQSLQDAIDEAVEAHSVPVDEQTLETHDAVVTAREALTEWESSEAGDELRALESLQEELEGYCDDWRYGVQLIRDSYFEMAMDELIDDIGEIPKNLPCYLKVTIDYDALQMDYTSAEFDGVTYWAN